MELETVYIEPSVISYYVARPSRDVIVLANQQMTIEWWENDLPRFEPFISSAVIEEISRGDREYSRKRLDAVQRFAMLEETPEVKHLADEYRAAASFPKEDEYDCAHLAFASWHGIDFLVTWNCSHIANVRIRAMLEKVNAGWQIRSPMLCTPAEMKLPGG